MLSLIAQLRRGVQPAAASCGPLAAAGLQPWDGLQQALIALSLSLGQGSHPGAADARRALRVAAASAASHPSPGDEGQPRTSSAAAAQRDTALDHLRQRMQAALARGSCDEVLRLLPPDGGAAAGWPPRQSAALFDLALAAAADSANAELARRLVGRMWRLGVPVGLMAHTAVLRALCAAGRRADALAHLWRVPSKRRRTPMFTLLLRQCNRAGDTATALECYELWQRGGRYEPDARFWAEAVRMRGAAGDPDGAEAAWQAALATARSEGEEARLHAARVAALAAAGRFEAALAALEAMLDRFAALLPVDVSVPLAGGSGGGGWQAAQQGPEAVRCMQAARNELLAAAQAAGRAGEARRAAALATLRGLPPDRGTYHNLLRASLAHGDGLAAVREGVEEMRRLGLPPTRETLSLCLKACAAERDPGAAHELMAEMEAEGLAPSRVHHNALLHMLAREGDLQGIEEARSRMRAAAIPPDASTFHALLACVRHWAQRQASTRPSSEGGTAAQVERTLQRRQAGELLAGWAAELDAARPPLLDQGLFVALLHAFSHAGEIHSVLLLMRDAFGCQLAPATARQLGQRPAARHAQSGAEPAADARLNTTEGTAGGEADTAPGRESPSSSSDRSSSRDSSSSSGWGEGAPPLVAGPLSARTLRGAHLAPSLPLFNAAIGACVRVGRWHLADGVALLRSLLAAGLAPDVHTFTSLVAGCAPGQQAALARELWRQMEARGIRPTTVTHNAMLKVELFTYGVDAGVAYLRRMTAQGVQPDRASWSTLLAAARYHQRADVAESAAAELAAISGEAALEDAAPSSVAAEPEAEPGVEDGEQQAPEEDHRWHGYYEQQEEEDDW